MSVWAALAWWVALSIPIGITLGRAIDRHHHQEETEMTTLAVAALVAASVGLTLTIIIARRDAAEARRADLFRGRS